MTFRSALPPNFKNQPNLTKNPKNPLKSNSHLTLRGSFNNTLMLSI